jgi:hypothetical protein
MLNLWLAALFWWMQELSHVHVSESTNIVKLPLQSSSLVLLRCT